MTKKTTKVNTEKQPTRTLKKGFNMYTALMNTPRQATDEDAYRILSSKPDTTKL